MSDVSIRLIDMNSKAIWMEHLDAFDGQYNRAFDRGDLASGIYMLQIHTSEGSITRKIVINK